MIDTHAHILYGIDDGAVTIEESLTILKKMSSLGYTKIIVTPHYMENTKYIANNKKKKEIVRELQEYLEKENINIELYLGNEVYIFEEIIEKIKEQAISTMHQTNYLLIELPLLERLYADLDILFDLISCGVHVILAHPERYTIFQESPKLMEKYTQMGVLLQGNLESFIGKYGPRAEKLAKRLLKQKKYFILGSDIHHENSSFFEQFEKIKKRISKLGGEDYFYDLVEKNPNKILLGIYEEND